MMNALTVFLALASAAKAHMIMKTPTPALSPNNSPLDASGSDFPCKIPGGSGTIPDTQKNVMTIGASNTLSFTGSAVHGGGSCQVSLAKGSTVNKNTKWMVIHSIEGGCPAAPAGGNFAADANGNDANTYQFTIPDHPDLGAGTYTLAWTWNNKIGNREMYMNCAYVDLQAAKKKRYMPTMPISKRSDSPLPDMFVAHINNGCSIAENFDVKYPNPGASVEIGSQATLTDPVGSCGSSGAQPANPSGSSSSSSGASSSAAAANTVQPYVPSGSASSSPSGAPTGSGGSKPSGTGALGPQRTQSQGGSFATVSAPGGGAQSSAAAAAPTAASSAASAPVASSAAAAQPTAAPTNGSTPAVPATGSCTNGYWLCAADGKSFKRCSNGIWSVDMQMAAGTACVPDTGAAGSATLQFAGVAGTPSKRDIRSHIARRAHGIHGSFLS